MNETCWNYGRKVYAGQVCAEWRQFRRTPGYNCSGVIELGINVRIVDRVLYAKPTSKSLKEGRV